MKNGIFDWLPQNENWANEIKGLQDKELMSWPALCRLASSDIDLAQTLRLDRLRNKFFTAAPEKTGTKSVRLALLGSGTTAHLAAGIRVGGLRHNLWIDVYTGDYSQYRQELEDTGSALYAFRPTSVLFAFDPTALLGFGDIGLNPDEAEALLDQALAMLKSLWQKAQKLCQGQIIQQSFLPTAPLLMGMNEARLPGSLANLTQRLNERLKTETAKHNVSLLSLDAQIMRKGLAFWHDPSLWHHAKQDISPSAAPLYGELVARLCAAQQGMSKKALVLDLDNTLWGGVIGDDSLDGISLGQGTALGESFVAFQKYVKELARRGIILAVCSKNDEKTAWEPFDAHPEMILKRSDIACFMANWEDKASNIRRIAAELNIGIDSLVFVDDNPFEREIVRRELPMVAVPEMPEDPASFPHYLSDAGYFEALALTPEDFKRTSQYQGNLMRENLLAASSDVAGYLASLDMRLVASKFDSLSQVRVAQLINKSNQFNLTTRRYSETELAAIEADPATITLQCRLIDKFGDNGLIGVLIAKPDSADAKTYRVDTWLMSCRVLGRQVEEEMLNILVDLTRKAGAFELLSDYLPTKKNSMVKDLYSRLGFSKQSEDSDGQTAWRLSLKEYTPFDTFIKQEIEA